MTNTKILTINDLIAQSGDSFLREYQYESGILSFVLEYDEDDTEVVVKVKADLVKFNVKNESNPITRTCRLEIIDLSKILNTKNGYYIPSNDFGKFMNEIRNGANLAYGKKAKGTEFLLVIIGHEPLIICTLNNLSDITFSIINS